MTEERFPARAYAETVLSVNFEDAKKYYLDALLEIHYAHTLMLTRQGIISRDAARDCLRALDALDRAQLQKACYSGECEDLFYYIEEELYRRCPDSSGRMHTARSRNDIDITQYRMVLRREILALAGAVSAARATLLKMALAHTATLMPAYTHTQPAQPTTLAHYLLAIVEMFGRDVQRLKAAFVTVNRCPLGACAIATTGFPIDRSYTAELLGFEGLQLNSYGAIAATDYVAETAGAVVAAAAGLGKVAQDLLLWCMPEFGYLRLGDAWVQSSSIMPQKRNPVALEHTRALASKALAQAQGVFSALHNTPFGDIVDSEDDLQPLVFSMIGDAVRAFRLFGGLMTSCEVNTARMAERAHSDFLTVTELADTLVRSEGISFRQAHGLVAEAVKSLQGRYSEAAMVDAVISLAGTRSLTVAPLKASREELLRSLDPANFVAIRRIPGGPALEAVTPVLADSSFSIAADDSWLASKSALLGAYPPRLRQESQALC